MRNPVNLATLGLAALLLTACDKDPTAVPKPQLAPVTADTAMAPTVTSDKSVPSAAAALPSAGDMPKRPPEAGRTNAPMTASQESGAMPMAGQNNDHSAPLAPAASAGARR